MLNDAEIAHYREEGYVVPSFRLPAHVTDSIADCHRQLLARHPEFRDHCPNLLAYDLAFLNYARNPEILDMVSQVLGPDFALWNSSFFGKPAGDGLRTPWHQDGEFWPIRPLATCTVWIAVDETTSENGCLRVIRGSHRGGRLRAHRMISTSDSTLNQELLAGEFDERDVVEITLKAGEISLHDVFLVHGSNANRTPRPRRGMTLRYMPTSSVFDRGLARTLAREKSILDHSQRTLFLMRGQDRSGGNDFRLRW